MVTVRIGGKAIPVTTTVTLAATILLTACYRSVYQPPELIDRPEAELVMIPWADLDQAGVLIREIDGRKIEKRLPRVLQITMLYLEPGWRTLAYSDLIAHRKQEAGFPYPCGVHTTCRDYKVTGEIEYKFDPVSRISCRVFLDSGTHTVAYVTSKMSAAGCRIPKCPAGQKLNKEVCE